MPAGPFGRGGRRKHGRAGVKEGASRRAVGRITWEAGNLRRVRGCVTRGETWVGSVIPLPGWEKAAGARVRGPLRVLQGSVGAELSGETPKGSPGGEALERGSPGAWEAGRLSRASVADIAGRVDKP